MDYWERKRRLPRGALIRIARRRKVSAQYVTQIAKGFVYDSQKFHTIRRDLAREMSIPVEVAFPDTAAAGAAPATFPDARAVAVA